MANQAVQASEPAGPVEEHYYRRGDIDFCFLLNRSHHNLRVFDYRVGNYQQKRDFFDRIARSEGLRKVFTVVEKQDSKSWRSVGFSREGAIPGYFRTADAYVMSRVYTEDGDPIQGGAPKLNAPGITAKEPNLTKPRGLNIEIVEDTARLAAIAEEYGEVALYAPFRRGMFHPDIAVHGRAGKRDYWVGAETDSSFGHAKVDIMTPPRANKEADPGVLEFLMQGLLDELLRRETASVFSLIAADMLPSQQVIANLGFKVTAKLTDHIVREDAYVGGQLWHRRLAANSGPRLSNFT
ncbi:hypothetical protein G6O69_20085 [Pseudenhygromyxa sp. WMMC2535]|uniref:hypothetical protein n=1 Tax=Pseudenhygromyxa sp. WMMC2535 TaxID=2712867 RepID=UPI001555FE34|nr:hypothetical protein [Pseudenhygromyxa sp. WMMC2535]NVB40157.1 hypothetical protein [Pseudenhygromyxa sp. WMMC2535]